MKWGLALINLFFFLAFFTTFTIMILYFKLRSPSIDYDSGLLECISASVSEGDEILADTQSVVVSEEYPFILNDAMLVKPCGQSGSVYEVLFLSTVGHSEALISKFEPDEWDPDTQLMESGIIYDCTGYGVYYVDFSVSEVQTSSEDSSSSYETDYQIGSLTFYTETGDSVAFLQIDDDRLSATLLSIDGETALAKFKRVAEDEPDFVITIGDTSNENYDTDIVFLSFGIWTFSNEIAPVDLCFIIKYGSITGSIIFGLLFIFALFISVSFVKQKSNSEENREKREKKERKFAL